MEEECKFYSLDDIVQEINKSLYYSTCGPGAETVQLAHATTALAMIEYNKIKALEPESEE